MTLAAPPGTGDAGGHPADASPDIESGTRTGPGAGPRLAGDGCLEVRVWDLPVRLTHWAVAASILVLSVTGLYLAQPLISTGSRTGFLMGTVRAVHVAAGWVFATAVLARVAWAFRGNRWARWDQFIPVRRERRAMLRNSVAFYAFVRREPPAVVGHNPLAGMTYLVLYLMFGVQILTGWALDALGEHEGWLWGLAGWVFTVAPIPVVRLVHHLIMWLTLGFLVHHLYSAILTDSVEHSGLISSIVTGHKRLARERVCAPCTSGQEPCPGLTGADREAVCVPRPAGWRSPRQRRREDT